MHVAKMHATLRAQAYIALFFAILLVNPISASVSDSSATISGSLLRNIEVGRTFDLSVGAKSGRMRSEFLSAAEKLNASKSLLPLQTSVESLIEELIVFVGRLASTIQLESAGLSAAERQVVANAHFDSALLHLSSVLPLFPPKVAKTSLFYSDEDTSIRNVELWKQDWLVKLAMAVEEDSASTLDYENLKHYVFYDIIPLNLPAALYHLNKASLLGHTSARSLFTILSSTGSLGLPHSMPLPESTYDKSTPVSTNSNHKQLESSYPTTESASQKSEQRSQKPVPTPHKVPKVADWKMLEHLYLDLSAGGKSPSALLLEGYQKRLGIDASAPQCPTAKNALREATKPLLDLFATRIPSPALQFNEHAFPPRKLMEQYSSQAMGSYKHPSQFEHMDLIDYYSYQAREPTDYQAKNTIGSIYLYGAHGFERNYKTALSYFREADQVHPSSQLGYMYQLGLGVDVDMKKATSIYTRAAAHNDSFALTQLGLLYLRGNRQADISPDPRKGLNFLIKAAERESLDAMFHLGLLYRSGLGIIIPADTAKSWQYIIVAASRGHLGAILELAGLSAKCDDSVHMYLRVLNTVLLNPLAHRAYKFYMSGLYDHAAVLYNIMAALGHETGQLNAAWLYERGLVTYQITPQDLANLFPLNVPALARGPHGATSLASTHLKLSFDALNQRLQYLSDHPLDHIVSLDGFLHVFSKNYESSEQELDTTAPEHVGDKATASAEDQHRAFELYRLAAQQGNSEAQLKQGDFYFYGIGVPVDYNRSAQFYLLASNLRHAQASFNLGYMYQWGLGVPMDFHLAKRYYDAAMTASPDAYLPSTIALTSLHIQHFLLGSFDPTDISWDNTLLILLLLAAVVTVVLKWRLH